MLARLERATNAHDVNAVVACFAADYRNETPAHPERSFTGREQVRRNWEQIFAAIPDITAKVLRSAVNGDEVWSEWEHRGTRRDGSAHRDARRRDFRRRQRTADLGALLSRAGSGGRRERRCRGSPAGRCRRPATTGIAQRSSDDPRSLAEAAAWAP